ncbi:MAG: LURP-one-related family protein [Clostridia bacterium]|nr:LURP-one-related family protein [Clostridia bacterium]
MVELNIRNKWFSFKGSSEVKDMQERPVLKVDGKFFSITNKKFVKSLDDQLFYMVRNQFFYFINRKARVYDANGNMVALVKKQTFSLHSKFIVTSPDHEYTLIGNILDYDFDICRDGVAIGHIARRISLRDSFTLKIYNDADTPFLVALVIALDNILDRRNSDAASYSFGQ